MKQITFLCLFLFLFITPAFAQEQSDTGSKINQPVDYQLPYPGILPDSPFYFFKPMRDRIIDFLTTDPMKKAEFDLLAADKRIAEAQVLTVRGKNELAKVTLSKGENYFKQAIADTQKAKNQGLVVSGFTEKLVLASRKYQEIITAMQAKDHSPSLEDMQKQTKRFEQTTRMLLK